jgi:integrase
MLAMHTGQRQRDLLRLPWSAYDDERISLTQSKGKRPVSVKCTAALNVMLDAMPRRATVILTTKTGRTWKKRYFADQWQETREAAGIKDLHFHDLRGSAVTMLAEAGATVPEIAAVTGHSLAHAQRILDKYLART